MTDKEIECVSPDEWAKALEDARVLIKLPHSEDPRWIVLLARALLAAQAEIERLTKVKDTWIEIGRLRGDALDARDARIEKLEALAEGMAGALETANHILWARLNDTDPVVDRAHRQIAAALAAYRRHDVRPISKEDVEIFDAALRNSVTVVHDGELARKQDDETEGK